MAHPDSATWIYLVRHGETDWNLNHRLQGQTDIPLNDRGRRQAACLRPVMLRLAPDFIYSSDLSRSTETARIALSDAIPGAEVLPGAEPWAPARPDAPSDAFADAGGGPPSAARVLLDSSLRERSFGRWEGLTRSEIRARFPELYSSWRTRTPGFCPPEGEPRQDVYDRVGRFLETVVERHRGYTVALFTHGGVVSAALAFALQVSPDPPLPVEIGNAGVSALRVAGKNWQVALVNETCHLASAPRNLGDER